MDITLIVFIFLLGCIVGSFLNVVIDRLPNGQSIAYPPSHCPHCRHKLAYYDLVPLFSFFYLKGKCRYCKAKISRYYPLIEVVTGALFVLTTFIAGLDIYLLFIISSLMIVFFIDLKYGIIPFKVVGITLVVTTVYYLFINFSCITNTDGIASPLRGLAMTNGCPTAIFNYLFSGIGVFVVFLSLFLVTRGRGIGFGDVVFSLLMGYVLGSPKIVLGVYIAFLTGAIISLILVISRRKKFKGGVIPFGPFLVTGTVVSLFWGQIIIDRLVLYFHVY